MVGGRGNSRKAYYDRRGWHEREDSIACMREDSIAYVYICVYMCIYMCIYMFIYVCYICIYTCVFRDEFKIKLKKDIIY